MEPSSKEIQQSVLQIKQLLKEFCKKKRGRAKKLCDALGFNSPPYIYKWFDSPAIPDGETLYLMFKFVGLQYPFIVFVYGIMLQIIARKEEMKKKGKS